MSSFWSTLSPLKNPYSPLILCRCLGRASLIAIKCINAQLQCPVKGRYRVWSIWLHLRYMLANRSSMSYSLHWKYNLVKKLLIYSVKIEIIVCYMCKHNDIDVLTTCMSRGQRPIWRILDEIFFETNSYIYLRVPLVPDFYAPVIGR